MIAVSDRLLKNHRPMTVKTLNFEMKRGSMFAAATLGLWIGTLAADILPPADLRKQALRPVDKMPGAEKDTPALVKLGRELSFEKALSENQSQSCSSCHQVDGKKEGRGQRSQASGRAQFSNHLERELQLTQFWDGRAEDLVAQAKGPVLNPVDGHAQRGRGGEAPEGLAKDAFAGFWRSAGFPTTTWRWRSPPSEPW